MNKQFIAVLILVVGLLFGLFAYASKDSSRPSSVSAEPSSHVIGKGTKGVTVLEYGDFECPGCESFYPVIKQLQAEYGDDVAFQFRNFPLPNHQNAYAAHRAAEAANKQGKFFEMHDLLFENQKTWHAQAGISTAQAAQIFEGYASQLGLNLEQFKADVASEEVSAIINADIKTGKDYGFSGTPSFVINGKKLETLPKTPEDFKKLIDEAIAASNSSN